MWRACDQVSRRVSELVLENHPAYAAELERVMELERSLQDANDICATGRQCVECVFLSGVVCFMAFGALTLLLWHQRERLVCKN